VSAEPRVLYVTGWGRSGSTVLNRMLSGPDVVGVGELRWLWRRGVLEHQSCACGQTWDGCALWQPVLAKLAAEFGDDEQGVAREMDALGRRAASPLAHLTQRVNRSSSRTRYVAGLRQLYQEIGRQAGAEVIVDISKHGGHAMLARETGLDVTILHLVRDPRAVVWSHGRQRHVPHGITAGTMPPRGAGYVAVRWTARNAFAELAVKPDLRVRYEDLVGAPEESLARVWAMIGIEPRSGSGSTHAIAGNLNRFDSAPLRLRIDDEWKDLQPRGQRLVTTALSLPVLRRYGYTLDG
jgi:hypothetical protein